MNQTDIFYQERESVISYLHRQLVGPYSGESECLFSDQPIARYLMGTLYPQNSDADTSYQDEDESAVSTDTDEVDDSPLSMVFQRLPASKGISFYVEGCDVIEVDVWGGRYEKVTKKLIREEEGKSKEERLLYQDALGNWPKWVRHPLAREDAPWTVTVPVDFNSSHKSPVFDGRATIHTVWRPMGQGALVTVTLLNAVFQDQEGKPDPSQCIFQSEFKCRPVNGTISEYPSIERLSHDDEEEELALQYRKNITYAVGHGCSATWSKDEVAPSSIQTVSMPVAEVKPVTTTLEHNDSESNKVLGLQYLANEKLPTDELVGALENFLSDYVTWFEGICDATIPARYESARQRINDRIGDSIRRIRNGITLLGSNVVVHRAFSTANRAMLMQMIHSSKDHGGIRKRRDSFTFITPDYDSMDYSSFSWRPFQLAYQLLVLESLVNDHSDDREIVDLLWFPTGGGKTEAYLSLAAFELIYRRLVFGEAGAGTVVIKRYTLRLLTTQQFQRAATLVCALELIRRTSPDVLGATPYTLGLWVGGASSPNKYTVDSRHEKGAYELYLEMLENDKPENHFQLQQCPWCGTEIVPGRRTDDDADYGVRATQTSFGFYCPSSDCELHDEIPVTVVDEDIYDNPPSFIIGTVDKFARLAWDHRAAGMFGDTAGQYRPPSLIIQDELHLISGPLGTVAGIYEAAIDAIIEAKGIRPKVIAATATIRRAGDQVEKLYGSSVRIFPPPGIAADDSYFSKTDYDAPGRLYVGVMGQGHTPITSLVHTSAALSQSVLEAGIGDISKDSWWTQVVYHNSRRELGKSMTLARDDIPERVKVIASDENNMRGLKNVEELSANVRGSDIPDVLSRLKIDFSKQGAVDVLPCTNMISVGVDVSRLGLMLIVGQPKTTAEYIQASSRVGRDLEKSPGIVVTLYSSMKPRDRSHYENFVSYHSALYRAVEPTSVTPYAEPARKRALHAALVIIVRHACGLGENADAKLFDPTRDDIQLQISRLVERMVRAEPAEKENVERHIQQLAEEWVEKILSSSSEGRPLRYYNRNSRQFSSLLRPFDSIDGEGWQTLNSMRNVDQESRIHLSGED